MQSVDGDVRLSVTLGTKTVKQSISELKKMFSEAMGYASGTAQSIPNQFDKVTSAVQKTTNKISEASKNAQKAISGSSGENIIETPRISTVPYEELEAKLGVIKERFEKIADEQEALANAGKINTDEFAKLESEANTVGAEIDRLTKLLSEAAEVSSYIEIPIPENANKLRGTIHNVQDAFREAQQSSSDFGTNVSESVGAVSSKYLQLQNNVQKAAEKVELAKLKLQEFQNQSAKPTTEYNALTKELTKVSTEMDKIKQKQDVFNSDYGGFAQYMSGYKELEAQMSAVAAKYDELNQKRLAMEQAGTALKSDGAKFQSIVNALKNAQREYGLAVQKANEYTIAQKKAVTASKFSSVSFSSFKTIITTARKALGTFTIALSDFGKKGKNAFTIIRNLTKEAFDTITTQSKKAGKTLSTVFISPNKSFKKGLKTIIKYGLGLRGLYAVIRKLATSVHEGYKNLAIYSNSVNDSVSSMLSVFTQFKNQAAATFQPLLTTIAPIINSFVNILNQALFSVAQFFAALTGQDYVYKAVKVQTSYVDKLEETTEAAGNAKKALQGYLSPLDEISKFTAAHDNTSISGNTKPEDMFETVEVESKFKDIADKFKNLLGNISSIVKKHDWKGLGNYIADMLNKGLSKIKAFISWDNLGDKITETVNAITDTINSFVDNVDWVLLGETIGEGVNTIVNTVALFIERINWANIGIAIADSLNGVFETVNWGKLGETLANGMLILPTILVNFIQKLDTVKVGNALSEFINSFVKQFKLFVENIEWEEIGTSIGKGIDKFLNNVNWDDIFTTIGDSVKGSFDLGKAIVEGIDWVKFGHNLTEGLKEVDWKGVWDSLTGFLGSSFIGLSKFFGGIGASLFGIDPADYERDFDKGLDAIGDWWESYKRDFGAGVDAIKKAWDDLWSWLNVGLDEQGNEVYVDPSEWIVPNENFFDNYIRDFQAGIGAIGDFFSEKVFVMPEIDPQITGFFENYVNDFQIGIDTIGKWFTEDIPKFFSDCWNSVTGFFEGIPQWFTDTFNSAKEGIENAWAGVGEWFGGVWENISGFFSGAGEWFSGVFDEAKNGIETAWKGVSEWFGGVWDNIKLVFSEVGTWFKTIFENAWRYIKKAWDGVGNWFSDVWNNIKEAFDGATQWFSDLFNDIWDAIKAPFEAVGNFFGDVWNNIKSAFGGGNPTVGVTVGATAGAGGTGAQRGMTLPIPKLAQGAVIPANREFVAMLGDQRNGTNLEAPESLIRKIFREETAAAGGGANNYQFTAQINRRTLFDEMITEAKLRRVINNKNPFELG